MDNLSFDQKIAMLATAKTPQEKAELISKFSNNADFYVAMNSKTMPLEQYMKLNYGKFKPVRDRAALLRSQIKNKGWTDKKYEKYLGELPEDLIKDRPEFSAYVPKKQRDENMRAFFKNYPEYSVDF